MKSLHRIKCAHTWAHTCTGTGPVIPGQRQCEGWGGVSGPKPQPCPVLPQVASQMSPRGAPDKTSREPLYSFLQPCVESLSHVQLCATP